MRQLKDLFLDKDLRVGGFYELAIQVCQSADNDPIRLYNHFIWTQKNVVGPFDINYNSIKVDTSNIEHNGILHLENYAIPFRTFNIREDKPVETGFNWFDIFFYTAAIEHIFGSEFQTWVENPKVPKPLTDFFKSTLKALYKIYPFQLAILGFEVSGQYYLDGLRKPIGNWTTSSFYVGQNNYHIVAMENRKFVTEIEKL